MPAQHFTSPFYVHYRHSRARTDTTFHPRRGKRCSLSHFPLVRTILSMRRPCSRILQDGERHSSQNLSIVSVLYQPVLKKESLAYMLRPWGCRSRCRSRCSSNGSINRRTMRRRLFRISAFEVSKLAYRSSWEFLKDWSSCSLAVSLPPELMPVM